MSRMHELLRLDSTGAVRRPRPSLPGGYHFEPGALNNRIDSVLTAPHFDSVAADALAAREVYADVVARLQRDLRCYILATLLATASRDLWPQRIARAFHVIPPENVRGAQLKNLYIAEDLRDSAHPEARTALAALGEIPWSDMTCRERSAFLLARIVTRMRWGVNG